MAGHQPQRRPEVRRDTVRSIAEFISDGQGDFNDEGCPDCEEAVLYACAEMARPDSECMFAHGIDPVQMYKDPTHSAHSYKSVAA